MYRIMLVEDEPPILYAVKHLIDSGGFGFEVSSVAPNGRDALKMLDDNVPDVIMTDIRMPFVDGLALIEEVRQKYPEIACVIMSGHSDFEYAVQALRTKAVDYLLKPIHMEKLQSTLLMLKESLDTRKITAELDAIIHAVHFEVYPSSNGIDFGSLQFVPILICAGHITDDLIQNPDHTGMDFWERTDLLKQLDHLLNEFRVWVLNGLSHNEKIVIIGGDQLPDMQMEVAILGLRERLMNDRTPVQIISRNPIQHVRELSKAVKKLKSTLSNRIIFGSSGLFIAEKSEPSLFAISDEFEKRCKALFYKVPIGGVKKNLLVMLKEWEQKQYTQNAIEQSLMYLTTNLMNWLKSDKGAINPSYAISEIVSGSANYQDLYARYGRVIDSIYESSDETSMSIVEIVERMELFLKANFTQPISYKMFYELYGYNETYLSHIFKVRKGITPNKYITQLRIEKAKEFMKSNPDTSLRNIASMVGYEDAFYFSRVFKDVTGWSPTEFIKHEMN